MAAPDHGAELDVLRKRVQDLESSVAENPSSVLSAVKALYAELVKWHAGQAQFPKSQLFGLVSAYLRPRIILIAGSIFALVIAGIELLVLVQQLEIAKTQAQIARDQNKLFKQQNELVLDQSAMFREQTRALRAQTAATLLSGLGSDAAISESQIAVVSSFGDVAFEALTLLSKQQGENGRTLRRALANSATNITVDQSRHALGALLQSFYEVHVSNRGEFTVLLTIKGDGSVERAEKKREQDLLDLRHDLDTISIFMSNRDVLRDVKALDEDSRRSLAVFAAIYYSGELLEGRSAAQLAMVESPKRVFHYGESQSRYLDERLTRICSLIGGRRLQRDLSYAVVDTAKRVNLDEIEKSVGAMDGVGMLLQDSDKLARRAVAAIVMQRECLPDVDRGLFDAGQRDDPTPVRFFGPSARLSSYFEDLSEVGKKIATELATN